MLLKPSPFKYLSFLCSGTSPPFENSPPQAGEAELSFPASSTTRSQACDPISASQRHPQDFFWEVSSPRQQVQHENLCGKSGKGTSLSRDRDAGDGIPGQTGRVSCSVQPSSSLRGVCSGASQQSKAARTAAYMPSNPDSLVLLRNPGTTEYSLPNSS